MTTHQRPPRPCLECGTLTSATRCPRCEAVKQAKRNASRPHYQGTWPATRARILKQWRAQYGDWCPGDTTHPAHQTGDLTVDHVAPRSGELGYTVLCRSANSAKGNRTPS